MALVALLALLSIAGCRNDPPPPSPLLPGLDDALPGLERVVLELQRSIDHCERQFSYVPSAPARFAIH